MKGILTLTLVIIGGLTAAITSSRADSGPPNGQFVRKSITVEGSSIPYAVYFPVEYTSKKHWPVILSLHGASEAGVDGWAPTHFGLGFSIIHHPEWFSAIVIFPQIPVGLRWTSQMRDEKKAPYVRELVMAALDHVISKFHGDPERVTLTGMSLGGQGVWDFGAREPKRFSALMPISGRRIEKELIPALVQKSIWVIQGAKDDVVPIEESQYMVHELLLLGAKHVRFTEIPNTDHDAWDPAYGDPEAIKFLIR